MSATSCCRGARRDTEDLDEAALAALVTRDCLIGVALPKSPR